METNKQEDPLREGETIIFTVDYDVMGVDVNGLEGMYYKTTSFDKCLIRVLKTGEWCEVDRDWVRRKKPGYVSSENAEYCSRVQQMKVTFET